MPTARDLLEQADALMRRNRARVEDDYDIPTLHDAVVPPAGNIELSLRPQTQPPLGDAALNESPATLDDVPVLTDAVEEIEAPSIVDAPPNEGEESLWLLEPGSEEAPTIVPSAEDLAAAREQEAAASRASVVADDFIFDVPPPEEPGRTTAQPSEGEPHSASPMEASPAHEWPEIAASDTSIGAPGGHEVQASEAADASAASAAYDEGASTEQGVDEEVEHPGWPGAEAVSDVTEEIMLLPAEAGTDNDSGTPPADAQTQEALPSDSARPQAASQPRAEAPGVEDSAQWSALAEEIRMQVLQRIDLFTDTGLREQLGARLKPIVDRASTDLVATISQHVGMLLRAYVSEAIEREIEKWRENGKGKL